MTAFASPTIVRAVAVLVLSAAGLASITLHEGKQNKAYLDPVGIVTVCVGHTETAKLGQTYSDNECEVLLTKDTKVAQSAVRRLVKVPLTQTQYDQLVSFTFNVGAGNLAKSTLLRKLNAGQCLGAANEFLRWDKAGGKRLPGLTKRRMDEAQKFAKDCS
jgi:lysozyme